MTTLYLGALAHLRDDPFNTPDALEIIESGALWVDDAGRIVDYGDRRRLLASAPESSRIVEFGQAWLIPGLVDAHTHFPQFYATAAYGGQLLDWLLQSILPAETAYEDAAFAERAAAAFVMEMLACGTTTAMVFGSQFFEAQMSLMEAADNLGLRMISGMTLMDLEDSRIPGKLLQSVSQAKDHAEAMIARRRGNALLRYAITPRYAMSCSPEMMAMCLDLLREHPDTFLQTHINENFGEIRYVMSHFRDCGDYLEVYERYGLVTDRTVLAHNIHAGEGELERIAQTRSAVCHCPSSNLFLGSGLFPLDAHVRHGIAVGVGTDIGAGTSFSIWRNLADAYKIQQLRGTTLDAGQLLYLGTLGGAKALKMDAEIGNFSTGKSADFFVLDPGKEGYLAERLRRCESWKERLFCLLHLATENQVEATFVAGRRVYSATSPN